MICPEPEVLDRFLRRQLSHEDSRTLSTHFDSCEVCRNRLELISDEQRLLDELQVLVPDPAPASGRQAQSVDLGLPERIGEYRVIEQIGMGGMGVVYLAEQDQPRREVALKVIHPSYVTPTALRRLTLEAAALGRLEHPGIAKVFASGSAEGSDGGVEQPFIAMEYVRGERVLDHCKSEGLDLRARVALVADMADAMHHAHSRGIIHRDLKPSNVMVDGEGRIKVIDFGLARLTQGDVGASTAHTRAGQVLGTLPYMSPEQVGSDPDWVDARADVYGLGALLYELLTGRPPYLFKGVPLPQAALAIVNDAVPAPSAHVRGLPKGLDWIALKALEKDPDRRYASAAALAEDLRHFLTNEPLSAGPPSRAYRMSLFVRRHKLVLSAAALIFLVASVGIGGYLAKSNELEVAAERFESDVDAIAKQTERCYRMRSRPGRVRASDLELGDTGVAATVHVEGETLAFFGLVDRAIERYRTVVERERSDGEIADRSVLTAKLRLTELCASLEDGAHAEELAREGIAATRDKPEFAGLMRGFRVNLARSLVSRADRNNDESEALLDEAEAAVRSVLEATDSVVEDEWAFAAQSTLGQILAERGDVEGAEEALRAALGDSKEQFGGDSSFALNAQLGLARLMEEEGRPEEAGELVTEVLETATGLLGANNPQVLGLRNTMGAVHMAEFRYAEAEAEFRAVLDGWELFFENADVECDATRTAWENLGASLLMQGKLDEAEPILEASMLRHREANSRAGLALSAQNLGVLSLKRENWESARVRFAEALANNTELYGDRDPRSLGSKHDLARALWRLERWGEAGALFEELDATLAEGLTMMGIEQPWTVRYLWAECLRESGEPSRALDVLWGAYEFETEGARRSQVRASLLQGVVICLTALEETEEALAVLDRALAICGEEGGVTPALQHWLELEWAHAAHQLGSEGEAQRRLEDTWSQLDASERENAEYLAVRKLVLGDADE